MRQFIITGSIPVNAFYDMMDEVYSGESRVSNKQRKVETGKANKPVKTKKHAAK